MTAPSACRLYLITPPAFEPAAFLPRLEQALDGGDVACVQLRLKDVDDDTIRRTCDRLRPAVQERGVAFLLNDRPDLAAATGCDGVHIGQSDSSYRDARAAVGKDAIVGVTCHDSRHLGMVAADAGADYVAFGAFFPSTTKDARHCPSPALLAWWSTVTEIPCVAIGGITPENCAPLVRAGADFLAISAAIWQHPEGPRRAVIRFCEAIVAAGEPDPQRGLPDGDV